MKVQYFGDVNDYRKFALLRLLAEVGGFRIGVNWMLTADDGSGQGAHRGYINDPTKWRAYDAAVFDVLAAVPKTPAPKDLRRIEGEALIPRATFFDKFLPDQKGERADWHAECLAAFTCADLAFFDPDNGLISPPDHAGASIQINTRSSMSSPTTTATARSILVYQHYPRHISRAEVIPTLRGE